MPESSEKTGDPGHDLVVAMVKGLASLTRSNELLAQKVEDLTSAMDDMRGRSEELIDSSDELAGYLAASLKLTEELSRISVTEDRDLTWGDVGEIIKGMKKEMEEEPEEDEGDEKEKPRRR
jgi:hypothetical protein